MLGLITSAFRAHAILIKKVGQYIQITITFSNSLHAVYMFETHSLTIWLKPLTFNLHENCGLQNCTNITFQMAVAFCFHSWTHYLWHKLALKS